MASYLIANYQVTNEEGYGKYLASVAKTILNHGGKILVAGPGATVKEGKPQPVTVVLEFPTRDALDGWYDSPEYRRIIEHRTKNTHGFTVFADQFVMP